MIKYTLFKHQQDAIDFAIEKNGCMALLHSCGTGKTITALNIYQLLKLKEPNLKLLVVCPKSIIRPAWIEDTHKFTDFTISTLKEEKNTDIIIVNFEYLIGKNGTAQVNKLLSAGTYMCVIDESQKLKNSSSMITKKMIALRNKFKYRIIASGTPTPNSLFEWWGQIAFIRPGILPDNFHQFRNTYFHLECFGRQVVTQGMHLTRQAMQNMFRRGAKYVISESKKVMLLNTIKPYCHYADKKDCLDLPDQIDTIREIELSAAEKSAYLAMKKHLLVELGSDIIVAKVAIAKLNKLHQITAGFAYDENHKPISIGTSKLNELEQVLENLGEQQAIIFIEYLQEINMILPMITAKYGNESVVTLYSETEDKDDSIARFKSGKAKYLVANSKSASHGITLTNCSTIIYYSISYSYELQEQGRNRIHRISQTKNCYYIYLIATIPGLTTIDEAILKIIQRKIDLQTAIREIIE